jgi:hypothetical protein
MASVRSHSAAATTGWGTASRRPEVAALRAVGAGAPDVPEAEVDSLEQLDDVY